MVSKLAVGVTAAVACLVLGACGGGSEATSAATANPSSSPSRSLLTEDNSVHATVINQSGKALVIEPTFNEEAQPKFKLADGASKSLTAKSKGFGQMKLTVDGCGGVVKGKETPGWIAFIKGWVATPPDATRQIGVDGPTSQTFAVFDSKYLVEIDQPNGLQFTLKLTDCQG